jgi:hypothetical protein
MPADDLVLNVRQIAGYPAAASPAATDAILIQRGGLGGPYYWLNPAALVASALSGGGDMAIGGRLQVGSVQTGNLTASNAAIALLGAQQAEVNNLNADWATVGGVPVATQSDIACLDASLRASTVWSVNGQRGDIFLDVTGVAGAAPIYSPRFQGSPCAPLAEWCDSSSRIATTAWVQRNTVNALGCLLRDHPFVFTFNGRTGDVTLTTDDITAAGGTEGLAPLDSPAFTGTPTAPTVLPGDNSSALATTAFVYTAVNQLSNSIYDTYAPLDSPNFSGVPYAPTANVGTATAQLATCAFVQDAVVASTTGVSSFNTRTGAITLDEADITNAGGAITASPVFTGIPQAPTAAVGNNSNQLATTSWVLNELGGANIGVSSFNGRGGAVILTSADLAAAGGALLNSPALTGVPTAPTAPTNTATNQLATTAFVMAAVMAGGVTSFNGREGAITLTANDVSAAGALVNPSPVLTGQPTAPTPPPATNNTVIATTGYVTAALAAGGGVASFNGRAGAVTLSSADVNAGAAGGPYVSLAQANARQNRNRLINADFLIDQPHGFAAFPWPLNAAPYVCDRWYGTSSVTTGITSRVRAGGSGFQSSGAPAADTLFIANGAAATPTAAQRSLFYQSIEYGLIADLLWGTANAAPVTLSFWVQASSPGTYSGVLRNYAGTRSYPFSFAITAALTWQFFAITIPGDTAGTWLTGNQQGGAQLCFSLGSGANFTAPAGAWATGSLTGATGELLFTSIASATLEFANFQLEAGTQATAYDWQSTGDVLAACQRYLQVPTKLFIASGYGPAGGGFWGDYTFPVTMRTAPTVTLSTVTLSNATAANATTIDQYGFRVAGTVSGTGTAFATFNINANADL